MSAWVFADWWEEDPITSYRPFRRFLNVSEQLIALTEAPPEIVGALIIKEATLKGEEAKLDSLCKYIGELDLSGRQLNYARFYGSQFRCVKLESAKLHGADLRRTDLHGADLSEAELSETKLHDADLSEAKLHGANLLGAKLHSADLYEAELHGADFRFAELHGADLQWAELHGVSLLGAELHGADLRFAKLHGADLFGAELHGANLFRAELHGADLRQAELHGVSLLGPGVPRAYASGAELYGADLSEAELYGAYLSAAELHGADLGTVILKNTDLPDVGWGKPKDWDNIIINIRDGLKKRGLADAKINKALLRIEEISSRVSTTGFGFISPNRPSENDCVFRSKKGPFEEWPESAAGCDIKLASLLADLACQNQWTAKGIVNRVIIYVGKDIGLIPALLNEDCSFLDPYREALINAP